MCREVWVSLEPLMWCNHLNPVDEIEVKTSIPHVKLNHVW